MTRPALTFSGLTPLALRIALILHSAEASIVRMDEIRAVADSRKAKLYPALEQLRELGMAELCPECDCLVGIGCDGQWCAEHQHLGPWRTRHLPDCPRAAKPVAAVKVEKVRRRA